MVHGASLILCVIEVVGLWECQLFDHPPQLSLSVCRWSGSWAIRGRRSSSVLTVSEHVHEQSMHYTLLMKRLRCYVRPLCRTHFSQTRPHQLRWGDQEMGITIPCTCTLCHNIAISLPRSSILCLVMGIYQCMQVTILHIVDQELFAIKNFSPVA